MADLDPLAAAGFAPVKDMPVSPPVDPLAAAGFAPIPGSGPSAPREVKISGVDMAGAPIFTDPADQKAMNDANLRMGEKIGEGATFGMLPHGVAAVRSVFGTPYSQGLQEARNYTDQTSKEHPLLSALGEGMGGLLPTALSFGTAAPLIGAAKAIPAGASMARALLSAGLGGVNAAGHDLGLGQTQTIVGDTAKGAGLGAGLSVAGDVLGSMAQAVPNAARSLYAGARNIMTDQGRQGIVGQVLREASGNFPNQAAQSAIPGLDLRASQATGNPGLASLESALASEPGIAPSNLGDVVTNNRTPNQVNALARAMVGSDAGIEPAVLTNQASARGVQAIQNVNEALRTEERAAWSSPILQAVRLDGPRLSTGVAQDVASFPASWRDAVTGSQGKLGAYLRELDDLGPNASISDINSVRSRLLSAARDAASGPQPDSVTAGAANRMASSILDRMGNDPTIAGIPSHTVTSPGGAPNSPATQSVAGLTVFRPQPPGPSATVVPATPPATATWNAYQHARDFTRQFNETKGFNEFNRVLYPNSQGNMQGNAERQFGQFFDPSGGSRSGLQRLQGLSDFARQTGLDQHANELDAATQQYLRASVLKQARAGSGIGPTGLPNTNLASLASTANRLAPAMNATPMTAPIAGDIQAAGNAAELINRPSVMRGSTNSTTFERLRQNDMVNAILGQSATSGLGGIAGGYAGYKYGPEEVPWYLRVPAGAMTGSAMGNTFGPALGNVISHTPVLRNLGAGTSENIRRQLLEALASMPAYNRAVATPMLTGPALSDAGAMSTAARAAAQAGLIPITSGGAR